MKLRVRVKNPLYPARDRYAANVDIPEYFEYEGEVLERKKWVGEDSFCLSTRRKDFPFRVIEKEDILCGWI